MTNLNMGVHIDELAFQKIMHWIHKAGNYEVSGLGSVTWDPENECMFVNEVYLLEQKNTGSTTDIDANAIGKLEFEHYKSGTEGELRFWWHSHANMGVFWSKTDMETIEMLGKGGWFVSTVFNAKEEMRSAFHCTSPYKLFADELDTTIISQVMNDEITSALESIGLKIRDGKLPSVRGLIDLDVPEDVIESWDEEYKNKVTEEKPRYTYSKGRYYPSSGGGYTYGYGHGVGSLPAHSSHKESFPDYDPSKKGGAAEGWPDAEDDEGLAEARDDIAERAGLDDADDVDNYKQEIIDLVYMYPAITREDIIDMYKGEVKDILPIIKMVEKEIEENL